MSLKPEHFMAMAQIVATAGTCSRLQVGSLLVQDRRVIATGYNGAPAGMPHCDHTGDPFSKPDQEDMGCYVAVHAELNAIAFAAKYGIKTMGSTLYVTHEPCLKCAQAIINAGVKAVLFHKQYRRHDGSELLVSANVPVGVIDRPELCLVPDSRGDGEGMYSSEPAKSPSGSFLTERWPEGEAPTPDSR